MPPRTHNPEYSRLISTVTMREYIKVLQEANLTNPDKAHYPIISRRADLLMILLNERKTNMSQARRKEVTMYIHARQRQVQSNSHLNYIPNRQELRADYLERIRYNLWSDLSALLRNFIIPTPRGQRPGGLPMELFDEKRTWPKPLENSPLSFKVDNPDWNFAEINLESLIYWIFDDEPDMWKSPVWRRSSKRGVGPSAYSRRIRKVLELVTLTEMGETLDTYQKYIANDSHDIYRLLCITLSWERNAMRELNPIIDNDNGGKRRIAFDHDNNWLTVLEPVIIPF